MTFDKKKDEKLGADSIFPEKPESRNENASEQTQVTSISNSIS